MRPGCLLVALVYSTVAAGFVIYENADNVRGRSRAGIRDLGHADDALACQDRCLGRLGADPTTGCTSFTFYHADYSNGSLAGHCFGDSTGIWAPFYSTYVGITRTLRLTRTLTLTLTLVFDIHRSHGPRTVVFLGERHIWPEQPGRLSN